ncbi:MAG: class I SAM-dependent methyltransferase [Christensenellaceae bacterium]|jgi:23S rRNA (cytosine1962-C5)-methyltransferase|nr:class I SAM-dependent methyltransferase [Christensenellaceae bacterium]
MRFDTDWKDYQLIAMGNGRKLENFGGVILLRPDPQIIWREPFDLENYSGLNAIYERHEEGGRWELLKPTPPNFNVHWHDLVFSLKLMGFKHTGIFPEQSYNWSKMMKLIKKANRPISVLNLFAYTGGASVACAYAGGRVCHVDAAKAMCERAGANARLSGVESMPMRYIIDDCVKFVERELRRGNKYDAIIMDPPAYGRGPRGEMWKLEDKIFEFVELASGLFSDNPLFSLINSYTTGLQPTVMYNILEIVLKNRPHQIDSYELGIPDQTDNIVLPCGASAFATFEGD